MTDFIQKATWLQSALNATEDIVFVKDRKFKFQACNKKMCHFLNTSLDSIIGKKDEDFFPQDAVDTFREIDSEVMSEGKTRIVEEWVKYPDGSLVLLETMKSPCNDDNGEIVGLIGISRDITERKRAEIELKKAKDDAENANRIKSRFLSNMSHEIRTPLNAVLGFAQILKGMESDLDKRFYLESILNSGKSLLKLLNDILDLSKVEAGKLDLQYAPVSMSSVFEDLSTIFAKDVKDKGLDYSVELTGFSKPLIIDPNRLSQILMNLVSNALKFTPEGFIGVSAKCEFVNDYENLADITISVKDSGIGIDVKDHEEIFGVFKQSQGQKLADYGGTGLGLSICSQLAALMDGTISVESTPGEGAEFTVVLKNVETAAFEFDEDKNDTLHFDPAVILIADDIDYNRELLKTFLEPYNFKILECQMKENLKESMTAVKPDVVFLDVKHSDCAVLELMRWLKSDVELRGTSLIPFAALPSEEDEIRVAELTGHFLRKPVSRDMVIDELKKLLRHTD